MCILAVCQFTHTCQAMASFFATFNIRRPMPASQLHQERNAQAVGADAQLTAHRRCRQLIATCSFFDAVRVLLAISQDCCSDRTWIGHRLLSSTCHNGSNSCCTAHTHNNDRSQQERLEAALTAICLARRNSSYTLHT